MSQQCDILQTDPAVGGTERGDVVRVAGNVHTIPAGGIVPTETGPVDVVLVGGVAQTFDIAYTGGRNCFLTFENVGANPIDYRILRRYINGAVVSEFKEEPPEADPALDRTLAAAGRGDWEVDNVRADVLRVRFLSAVGSTMRWYHREE